ncbi:hypothetical protein [uncultured Gimesia sp.]|uniref:hypothetical protein n=1 Tax=uncultured Gimesia sp. TaxID=1678688 RepID=UPI002620C3A3|nr:hypothetical protein [uncultured Gimesia sp.]
MPKPLRYLIYLIGTIILYYSFFISGCSSLLLSDKDRCLSELENVCPNGLETNKVYKKYADQECFSEVIDELISAEKTDTTDFSYAFYMLLEQLMHSPNSTFTHAWSWIKLEYEHVSIDCEIALNKNTLNAIKRGIHNKPQILNNLLYHRVQEDLTNGHGYDFQRNHLLDDYHKYFSDESRTKSSKFVCLIFLAALFGDPGMIEETNWENVEEKWRTQCNWLGEVAKFCVFDSQKKYYVVNQEALKMGSPVNTLKQIPNSHLNSLYQVKKPNLLED